jgi:hypothetical protein
MTLPGFIDCTISAVMSFGAGLPGMSAVVMMMSTSLACFANVSRCAFLEALAHHLRVAADAGAFLDVVDGNEFAAERLDLVGDLGTRVVGADDGAQARSGADGGESPRRRRRSRRPSPAAPCPRR